MTNLKILDSSEKIYIAYQYINLGTNMRSKGTEMGTIFLLQVISQMRIDAILSLKYDDVFSEDGSLKGNYLYKYNSIQKCIFLNILEKQLYLWKKIRLKVLYLKNVKSDYLFPDFDKLGDCITLRQYLYFVKKATGDKELKLTAASGRKAGARLLFDYTKNWKFVSRALTLSSQQKHRLFKFIDVELTPHEYCKDTIPKNESIVMNIYQQTFNDLIKMVNDFIYREEVI